MTGKVLIVILLVVLAFPDPAFPSEEKDEKKALAAQAKESVQQAKETGEIRRTCGTLLS